MSRLLPHYSKAKTTMMCIDLQKAFSTRIGNFANCVFVANRFAGMHNIIPEQSKFIVSEQYPKAFGNTVPEVNIPKSALVVAKTRFSAIVPEVEKELADTDNVIVFGIEGHACVLQTVADLLDLKKRVVLCVDGVGSYRPSDCDAALKLMSTWGPDCVLSTSECVLLQMAKDAKDAEFKKISALLREEYPMSF